MRNKIITGVAIGAALAVGAALAIPAFAETITPTNSTAQGMAMWGRGRGGMNMRKPGVFGTITAISGSTLTVTEKMGLTGTTNTTYSVDAVNATVTKDAVASTLSALAVGDMVSVEGVVNGTSVTASAIHDGNIGRGPGMMKPEVVGTVASVNGSSFTVTSKMMSKGTNATTQTTYTVDATNAKVTKNGTTSSISSLVVGDTVMVQGAVSGTTVTATAVNDGMPAMKEKFENAKPIIQGNGQPVIGGAVTAINGSSITITNKSNVTYTVDATNAFIAKANATSSLSHIANGDNVVVQGTVNGNAVTATSIDDSGATPTTSHDGTLPTQSHSFIGGIFGGIGGFFKHLFGFF